MTWRMEGLTRRVWQMPRKASGRCEYCGWSTDGLSVPRTGRLARDHTRETGHATRTAQVKVTEYRRAA